jgi:putative intracellular protease/amidase
LNIYHRAACRASASPGVRIGLRRKQLDGRIGQDKAIIDKSQRQALTLCSCPEVLQNVRLTSQALWSTFILEEIHRMNDVKVISQQPINIPANILIPLPDHDFDPTESAIPWQVCTSRGWKVAFSTEKGLVAQADHRLLKGPILGPLGAGKKALLAYRQMAQDEAYLHPIPYADIEPVRYDGLLLPGGHAPGARQYLDSPVLQKKALEFWQQKKMIGAICHGVLVLARTIDPQSGRSILYGCKVTAVTKQQERFAFYLTFWILGRRYRTYTCYTADEVRGCLEKPEDFQTGKSMWIPFVVEDGNLITARAPLDVELFAKRFADKVAHVQTPA